ncbi:MAG: head GIN domain-containing protein [Bacteroidales bacterium]|jgi:hypothetical protein|nr:head GIN domain-containing protein [Bacteroidales bacterium]
MKNSALFLTLITFIIYFSGCKKNNDNDCIVGNGDLTQETRVVGNFSHITANGAYNISFSQTSISQVDLFGDSNILPIISTNVSNGILNIGTNDDACYSTQNTIEITATAPQFEGITLEGAGKIEAHNITTDQLRFETNGAATINSSFTAEFVSLYINGSGDAQLTGSAGNSGFYIGGAGSIQASTLIVDICTITTEGSGDIYIHVNNEMTVVINGSGNVYYTGDPDINSQINGTGQLIKMD